MLNIDGTASISEVLNEDGQRRVYVLRLDKSLNTSKKSAVVMLNLERNEDQKPYFYNVLENHVIVNIHHCKDLDKPDSYYVWEPRLLGRPNACSRCKDRLDIVRNSDKIRQTHQ